MRLLVLSAILFWGMVSCKSDAQLVKVDIDAGAVYAMMESGSFGSMGTISTYWMVPLQQHSKKGFIVFSLQNDGYGKSKAELLFDSLMFSKKADTELPEIKSGVAKWDSISVKEFNWFVDHRWEIRQRFNAHIRLYVEPSAIKTGMSEKAIIKYE